MLIKAGTYRFNDVLSAPSEALEHQPQNVNFTFDTDVDGVEYHVEVDYINLSIQYVFNAVAATPAIPGYELPQYFAVYFPEEYMGLHYWNTLYFGEGIKTITIPYDQEGTEEFGTWFYANVKEQKQISGKWKFKDVLTAPSGDIAADINYSVTTLFKAYGVTVQGNCNQLLVYLNYDGEENVTVYRAVSSVPDFSAQGVSYPIPFRVYSAAGWNYTGYDEGIQTIDFGTEPQTVSAEFYDWFIANAKPESDKTPIASIHYNGSTIASLFGGQTATVKLKGDGVQVVPDIVVEVAELPEAEVVEDSPLPIEVETEAEMTSLLESGEAGGVYKYTGTTGTYETGALYICVNTITFTFQPFSIERQAVEGMTWGEFVNSDYNVPTDDGYLFITMPSQEYLVIVLHSPYGNYYVEYGGKVMTPTDVIINGAAYIGEV